jgi:nucleoside-diphosphate-sugar epimerase
MVAILRAGGAIGNELVKELTRANTRVRLVSRNPRPAPITAAMGSVETVPADISDLDQTIEAVAGSEVVPLLVGLKYDCDVWRETWPRIMRNAAEACKRTRAKLVFFDNVYMYGKVAGKMTEETPFNPCSRKGEIRARIAMDLLNEVKAGNLTAMIARSADFYDPDAKTSVANLLVFEKFAKGDKAAWLVNDSVRRSFTFPPNAAKSLVLLCNTESAWNQTWHVPTAPDPPTGKEFIEMVAEAFGVPARYRVLNRPMLKVAGWFDKTIAESYEMLYGSDSEQLFDSTKFNQTFQFEPTAYRDAVNIIAGTCQRSAA